jgi:nucleotide-binding universal stress UspA family protein
MGSAQKILVAIGFTKYSQEIFDYAVQMAGRLEAELIVGSVINSRDVESVRAISAMGYDVDGEHYVSGVKTDRKNLLEEILAKSNYRAESIRTVFRVGHPIDELLKMIVRENVDMVIMGIKGRTDLENVFIGSVAEKIFRRSPVPVLSYRDEKNAARLKNRISL